MTDDDIPLDITGHEDRERPGDDEGAGTRVDDQPVDDGTGGDDASADAASDGDTSPDDGSGDNGAAGSGRSPASETPIDGSGTGEDGEETVEPVEVLVGLAEDGEIDPWDIDVVAVTDKFLAVVEEDLRTSGRALFYASVLVRMKSDALFAPDEADEPPVEPWEAAAAGEESPIESADPFATLEREMDRRLERRRARGMPQTLDELVRDLREAERDSWWKQSREYDTSDSPRGFQRGTQQLDYRSADDLRMADEPTSDDVTANTHTEDIETVIDDLLAALADHYEAGRDEVLFREVADAGGSRTRTFLAALFLSHRGRVRLRQDDLFGDLWIQDAGVTGSSEEALAD